MRIAIATPHNLPRLARNLTGSQFLVEHRNTDYSPESILVTIESHYWLEPSRGETDADVAIHLEQLAEWMSDWATYELESVEGLDSMTLGEWLEAQIDACAEDTGRYDADMLHTWADLADCYNYLPNV